jgi:chromatin assembly factor 1 subunit A
MRLNAFFVKPASRPSQPQTAATNPSKPGAAEPGGLSKSEPAEKKPSSDYEQGFPPFFVQSHVKLAPSHHFTRDPAGLDHARQKIDTALGSEDVVKPLTFNPTELFNIRPYKRRQGRTDIPTVRDIVTSMQHSPANTIDLTGNTEPTKHATRVEDMLKKIPVKMLKFGENVRPPYRGTFTKKIPGDQAVKLCRNPFARVVREFNYDYDSEAEWEEPEEGEDLDTSGDEDPSEDDADDLDDFLDDADDELKRRNIVGSLEPICSGIRWVDGRDVDPELKAFRMELLCGLSLPVKFSFCCSPDS